MYLSTRCRRRSDAASATSRSLTFTTTSRPTRACTGRWTGRTTSSAIRPRSITKGRVTRITARIRSRTWTCTSDRRRIATCAGRTTTGIRRRRRCSSSSRAARTGTSATTNPSITANARAMWRSMMFTRRSCTRGRSSTFAWRRLRSTARSWRSARSSARAPSSAAGRVGGRLRGGAAAAGRARRRRRRRRHGGVAWAGAARRRPAPRQRPPQRLVQERRAARPRPSRAAGVARPRPRGRRAGAERLRPRAGRLARLAGGPAPAAHGGGWRGSPQKQRGR